MLYLFLGDNNVIENSKRNKELRKLENDLQHYKATVASMKTQNNRSTVSTKEEREEYFRKHHYLKKDDEDVFRIVYKK